MKSKLFFATILLMIAFTSHALVAGNQGPRAEKQVLTQALAQQAVADFYHVVLSDVLLFGQFNNNGNTAWNYKVISLDKKGTVTETSSGYIVEEDVDGF